MNNIIVADDSRTARMIIMQCLKIIGLNPEFIWEANNGIEVLEILKEHVPDLLITDLNMPEMDGEQLMDEIHHNKRYKFPIVFITSAGNPAKELELKNKGSYAVIKKPVYPPDMAAKLKPLAELG